MAQRMQGTSRSRSGRKGGMSSRGRGRLISAGRKGGRSSGRRSVGRKGGGVQRRATEAFRHDIMTAIERFTDRLIGRGRSGR